MEEFLSSNGVRYEHHDLATDAPSVEYLRNRGIKSVPVTIIDEDTVIIGYYPKKLVPALDLKVKVDLSSKTDWLAQKYDVILSATLRATQQLGDDQLKEQVPWRPWSLRDVVLHIMSFPELAYLSHKQGSMSSEDMAASNKRLATTVNSSQELHGYGEGVRKNIIEFLNSGNETAFDRVVPAHYGGEVTVVELLNIILSHSTHHLKQLYHHMETGLSITPNDPASEKDFDGIVTPTALI
ncbi:MAG: hypothetical protein BZY80_05005 [SAR202 cluster bacterium Io17-Chloro-G2]|nr:MAG: hypothetical protein BZY80_05005 [SAR202 cluster bacterium Io17-Chloro-G2]